MARISVLHDHEKRELIMVLLSILLNLMFHELKLEIIILVNQII